ncbi:transcriptional regulator of molybdate metabolism, LysR family [Staphylothermus hellenicus DSM 12710]|uniref:Transcriptional regulator of molybdate metabolism, LysR family n=1 Tax=Staphylothermus hellenicus (strain DSM 12710 / JCM 10830 / BK20S6-10-b1 / P8) TaxID=591019 RepID=D7DBW9_STAHD|nr:transcriptional regulator of molybdate metabolism, LysR family [Staphylothermus hellenicus DSM 12710]
MELKLVLDGYVVLDELSAKLLYLINRLGSILSASRVLGLSYSSAWDMLTRIENILGRRVVEKHRGARGGATLTSVGLDLLERYISAYKKYFHREFHVEIPRKPGALQKIYVYAGSHDILINYLTGLLRDKGYVVEVHWIGSLKGLSSIILGEADFSGTHLLDPDTGEYNVSFIEKYGGSTSLALIRGWLRSIGFITRSKTTYEEIIEKLVNGTYRLINRNEGSGSRQLLEYILKREAEKRNTKIDIIRSRIKGYKNIAYTHLEVAEQVSTGKADIGIGIEWAAKAYNLYFKHIKWENFDIVIRRDKIENKFYKDLTETIKSKEFIEKIKSMPGYKVPENIGEVLFF